MSTTVAEAAPVATEPMSEADIDFAVDQFANALREWETKPILLAAQTSLAINGWLIGRARQMFDALEAVGPRGCVTSRMEFVLCSESFRERLAAWMVSPECVGMQGKDPAGGPAVWSHYNEAIRNRQGRRPKEAPPPLWMQVSGFNTIEQAKWQLEKIGIDARRCKEAARQIGWKNQYGEPDAARVMEDIRSWMKTGESSYDPTAFVDTKYAAYERDLIERFTRHRERVAMRRGQPTLPPFPGESLPT
jgi:hypothetical protein